VVVRNSKKFEGRDGVWVEGVISNELDAWVFKFAKPGLNVLAAAIYKRLELVNSSVKDSDIEGSIERPVFVGEGSKDERRVCSVVDVLKSALDDAISSGVDIAESVPDEGAAVGFEVVGTSVSVDCEVEDDSSLIWEIMPEAVGIKVKVSNAVDGGLEMVNVSESSESEGTAVEGDSEPITEVAMA